MRTSKKNVGAAHSNQSTYLCQHRLLLRLLLLLPLLRHPPRGSRRVLRTLQTRESIDRCEMSPEVFVVLQGHRQRFPSDHTSELVKASSLDFVGPAKFQNVIQRSHLAYSRSSKDVVSTASNSLVWMSNDSNITTSIWFILNRPSWRLEIFKKQRI